jgi:hypothetical protein
MESRNLNYCGMVISSPDPSPIEHPVENPGCLITAYGTSTTPLLRVYASVGQWSEEEIPTTPTDPAVSQFVEGFVSGCGEDVDWCFEQRGDVDRRVPGARGCGLEDMLVVWGYESAAHHAKLLHAAPCVANRLFRGVGGCCSGSGDGVGFDLGPPPLFAVAPRFLQIALAEGQLSLTDESEILMLGGLLQCASVTLTYDPYLGKPDEPVWRNADMQAVGGEWVLRVARNQHALDAQLTFQRVTGDRVLQPLTWQAHDWDFSRANTLGSSHRLASGKGLPAIVVSPETR